METMNGQKIYVNGTDNTTIFVPIPRSIAKDIDGGCCCDFCKAHPEQTPKWDTLALPSTPEGNQHTWTVHFPNIGSEAMYREHLVKRKKR